jgi:hypothetical protein
LGPSPLSVPQPEPPGLVFKTSPLAAHQSTPPALVVKSSPLAAPWSEPSVSAPEPIVPKTVPVSATQPISVAKTPSAPSSSSVPNAGGGGIGALGGTQKGANFAGSTAPRRGRGVLTQQNSVVGARIALCAHCNSQIRYFSCKAKLSICVVTMNAASHVGFLCKIIVNRSIACINVKVQIDFNISDYI